MSLIVSFFSTIIIAVQAFLGIQISEPIVIVEKPAAQHTETKIEKIDSVSKSTKEKTVTQLKPITSTKQNKTDASSIGVKDSLQTYTSKDLGVRLNHSDEWEASVFVEDGNYFDELSQHVVVTLMSKKEDNVSISMRYDEFLEALDGTDVSQLTQSEYIEKIKTYIEKNKFSYTPLKTIHFKNQKGILLLNKSANEALILTVFNGKEFLLSFGFVSSWTPEREMLLNNIIESLEFFHSPIQYQDYKRN